MVDLNLGSFCFRFVRVHFWSEVGLGASKAPPITDTAFCRDFPFRALFSRLDINHVIYLVRSSLRLFELFFDSIPDELQLKERYVLVG